MGRKIETPGFKESNKGDDEKRKAHGYTVMPQLIWQEAESCWD
jgi:hypothetical protein